MANPPDPWRVDLEARVQDLPLVQAGVKLPTPVIVRADALLAALDEAGEHRPDRQFLIAALLYASAPDARALTDCLRAYRLAKVHEVLVGETQTSGEIALRKPGA
jgi:hypothetical protein